MSALQVSLVVREKISTILKKEEERKKIPVLQENKSLEKFLELFQKLIISFFGPWPNFLPNFIEISSDFEMPCFLPNKQKGLKTSPPR